MAELFGDIGVLQQVNLWKPTSLEELLVGAIMRLVRLARANFNLVTSPAVAFSRWIWKWLRPHMKLSAPRMIIRQVRRLVVTLWKWLQKYTKLRWEFVIKPILLLFLVITFSVLPAYTRGCVDRSYAKKVATAFFPPALMAPSLTTHSGARKMVRVGGGYLRSVCADAVGNGTKGKVGASCI